MVNVLGGVSSTSAEGENLGTVGAFAVTEGSVKDGDGPVGQRNQNSSLDVPVERK